MRCASAQLLLRRLRGFPIIGLRLSDFPLFLLAGFAWLIRPLVKSRKSARKCRNLNRSVYLQDAPRFAEIGFVRRIFADFAPLIPVILRHIVLIRRRKDQPRSVPGDESFRPTWASINSDAPRGFDRVKARAPASRFRPPHHKEVLLGRSAIFAMRSARLRHSPNFAVPDQNRHEFRFSCTTPCGFRRLCRMKCLQGGHSSRRLTIGADHVVRHRYDRDPEITCGVPEISAAICSGEPLRFQENPALYH